MSQTIGAFLGRFQPFHVGHMSVVDDILHMRDRLILIIGSADKSRTEENPWTTQERESIIRATVPLELQERMDIVSLNDFSDDDDWAQCLSRILPEDAILYTGNDWVREICERHKIFTQWISSYRVDISGTKIREMLQKGEDVSHWTQISGACL